MDDLISREYLIGAFKKFPATNGAIPKNAVEALIEDAPVADNVVRGEWVKIDDWFYFDYQCNICCDLQEFATDFCPNCGAKMVGKEEGAE